MENNEGKIIAPVSKIKNFTHKCPFCINATMVPSEFVQTLDLKKYGEKDDNHIYGYNTELITKHDSEILKITPYICESCKLVLMYADTPIESDLPIRKLRFHTSN